MPTNRSVSLAAALLAMGLQPEPRMPKELPLDMRESPPRQRSPKERDARRSKRKAVKAARRANR